MEAVNLVMISLIGIVVICIVFYILIGPFQLLLKLLTNSLFGILLLLLTNFVGAYFSFFLPINLATILISGFLGIPGILFLVGIKFLFYG